MAAAFDDQVAAARDGFCVTASAGLGALADADTVVVPGYRDIDAKPSGDVLAARTIPNCPNLFR